MSHLGALSILNSKVYYSHDVNSKSIFGSRVPESVVMCGESAEGPPKKAFWFRYVIII